MSKSFDVPAITSTELSFLAKSIRTYNHVLIDVREIQKQVTLSEDTVSRPTFNIRSNADHLRALPTEVLLRILGETDLETIFRLRASCQWIKYLIETWGPYQTIMSDARGAVGAMIATKASRLWTVPDLASRVYTTTCEICRQHGEILHLLKMQRVCFNCVTTDRSLLAVSPEHAQQEMGLDEDEMRSLPHISTIRQKTFWGAPGGAGISIDYTAAVALATEIYFRGTPNRLAPSSDINGGIGSFFTPICHNTGIPVDSEMQTRIARPRRAPVCKRRRAATRIGKPLPRFLFRAPEACYAQHAACVFFPTLQKSPAGIVHAKALLCAGCVHYWNYHSPLPTECHQLFPHEKSTSTQTDRVLTPFEEHLSTCIYARAYWDKLYPEKLNYRNASNSDLVTNGGTLTASDMHSAQLVHVLTLTTGANSRHRHAMRHSLVELRSRTDNNTYFELIPSGLMKHVQNATIDQRTGLEIELESKLNKGDPIICKMLAGQDDSRSLGRTTTGQPEQMCNDEEDLLLSEGQTAQDYYWDALLGSNTTVSQATWATSRPAASNALFRGWAQLLQSRAQREAEIYARSRNTTVETEFVNMFPWGLDRFGNISDMI